MACRFALAILLALGFAGTASAAIIINSPMTDATNTTWTLGGNPNPAILTGNGAIDTVGNGWLRLTNATGNQTGYAYNNTTFDLSAGLLIEFDYATWGGNGADGYSVYLFDANVGTFNIGAFGGSLGYAQKGAGTGGACSANGSNVPGISGGYVGIGVDEFGNFSDCAEGRYLPANDNTAASNTVTLRGAVAGFGGGAIGATQGLTSYPWISTSATAPSQLWYNGTPRPSQTGANYRKVRIQISPAPNPVVNVWVAFGYGSPLVYAQMITNQALPAISTSQQLKMGYAASTGGSTNYHEIRNLLVSNQSTTSAIDLAITKTFTDITTGSTMTAFVGDSIRYTIIASNTGPNNVPANGVGIQDTVPAMITNVNWTCSGSGVATCPALGSGNTISTTANLPLNGYVTYTVTGTVGAGPAGLLSNTASLVIPGSITDYNSNNNSAAASMIVTSDLSTSTKTWWDQNGGDQNPGDTIQYTITLKETAGSLASGVSVTDAFPATLSNLAITSCPSGATCTIAGQMLTVSNITVPANTSAAIVVSTVIAAGTAVGTLIDNSAAIINPFGPGAAPAAPTIIVSQSQIPVSGNKQLYLYGGAGSPYKMSRTPTPGAPTTAAIAANGGSAIWNGNSPVALQLKDTITAATASIYINGSSNNMRSVEVRLYCSSNAANYAFWGPLNLPTNPPVPPALPTGYALPLTSVAGAFTYPYTCFPPNYWVLQTFNRTTTAGRTITVVPVNAGNISQVILASSNVINVDSIGVYSAPSPSMVQPVGNNFVRKSTVYLRPSVSDPFGAFDISSASITISDSTGSVLLSAATITNILATSTTGTNNYEYAYTIPVAAAAGPWTYRVVAKEGTENTISDTGVGTFNVYLPNLLVLKSAAVWSDPISGTTVTANPRAIPGTVMTYTILVSNSDPLPVTNVVITDSLAAEIAAGRLAFRTQFNDAANACAAGSGIVVNGSCNTNPNDADNANWNVTTLNTVTVSGLSIPSNGSATIKFQVVVQ